MLQGLQEEGQALQKVPQKVGSFRSPSNRFEFPAGNLFLHFDLVITFG
jgi:hypothetical protein